MDISDTVFKVDTQQISFLSPSKSKGELHMSRKITQVNLCIRQDTDSGSHAAIDGDCSASGSIAGTHQSC